MILQDFIPAPALRKYIKCFRIIHFYFDRLQPIPYKSYPPKPEQTLHFFLKEPFLIETSTKSRIIPPTLLLTTQQTSLVRHYTGFDFIDVQIVFQPTAVFHLTGISAKEITQQFLDATLIFPASIESTFCRLRDEANNLDAFRHPDENNYDKMIFILETFSYELIAKLKTVPALFDEVCSQMVNRYGNVSIDGLAKDAHLSPKQFKRKFVERVGVNPKTYARILCLNRAYNIRNCFPLTDWNTIALRCGYTDYQHLAKSYKEFNGLTPPELHNLEIKSPESVLGLTKKVYRNRVNNF